MLSSENMTRIYVLPAHKPLRPGFTLRDSTIAAVLSNHRILNPRVYRPVVSEQLFELSHARNALRF